MSTSSASTARLQAARPTRRRAEQATQELPDYCARPACRRPFSKVVGPGRPQAFCSEVCRRAAEKELRQAKSTLAHFEALIAQLRVDIAAFGRGGLGVEADPAGVEAGEWQAAAAAVHRVGGVLAFLGDSDEALAQELRALHSAVSPVILNKRN